MKGRKKKASASSPASTPPEAVPPGMGEPQNPDESGWFVPGRDASSFVPGNAWFCDLMKTAPWLTELGNPADLFRIPRYTLPGTEDATKPPTRNAKEVFQYFLKLAEDERELAKALGQRSLSVVFKGEIPTADSAAVLAREMTEVIRMAVEVILGCIQAGEMGPKQSAEAYDDFQTAVSASVRQFAEVAPAAGTTAALSLLEIAECAIQTLESREPGIEEVVQAIAPSRERWPQMCGALPEDLAEIKERLASLKVGTRTVVRKSYGARGRPISYRGRANVVAQSMIQYITRIRRLGHRDPFDPNSALSKELHTVLCDLPELDAASAQDWVRVAERIVKECCGCQLEEIEGLAILGVHREGKTMRTKGTEPFAGDIRDGVRAALVQAFRTIAQPPPAWEEPPGPPVE